jgi:hypothetical protein
MKKIYVSPSLNVVKVELAQMVATSIAIGNNYNGSSEIESRRGGSDWDDDDDDY